MKKALVILAHGSRVPETSETVKQLAEQVKKRAKDEFEIAGYAFLQFAKPELEETVEKLIEEGATDIVVAPFFLFAGHHMQHDLPEALEEMNRKYPEVSFKTSEVIGQDPRMADIMLDQIRKV